MGSKNIRCRYFIIWNKVIEEDDLEVPHPRMSERAFVLIPLNDIAPTQIEPRSKTRISDLVIPDDTVKKYKG